MIATASPPRRRPLDPRTAVQFLPGVGPARARHFERLGLHDLGQLVRHYPREYLDARRFVALRDLEPGQLVTVSGTVQSAAALRTRTGRGDFSLTIRDATGVLPLLFLRPAVPGPHAQARHARGDERRARRGGRTHDESDVRGVRGRSRAPARCRPPGAGARAHARTHGAADAPCGAGRARRRRAHRSGRRAGHARRGARPAAAGRGARADPLSRRTKPRWRRRGGGSCSRNCSCCRPCSNCVASRSA